MFSLGNGLKTVLKRCLLGIAHKLRKYRIRQRQMRTVRATVHTKVLLCLRFNKLKYGGSCAIHIKKDNIPIQLNLI